MKPIKIEDKNGEPIKRQLAIVNGRHTQHTFADYLDVRLCVQKAEAKLHELIPAAKYHVGAQAVCISGAPVPKTYKYRRTGTRIRLERRASGWFLTEVEPVNLWQRDGGTVRVYLTAEQNEKALTLFRASYGTL
jgi:hypothetical protein